MLFTEHYALDREADLAKVDLARGWGPMSDDAILKQIDISQRNRFYYWHVDAFPIPREAIETNSANMHMVAADSHIEKTLKASGLVNQSRLVVIWLKQQQAMAGIGKAH